MSAGTFKFTFGAFALLLIVLLLGSSCLPKPPHDEGGLNITLYGFSIMKESLEKSIYPGFAAKWKAEHGQDVRFTSSFAGSETITNQIMNTSMPMLSGRATSKPRTWRIVGTRELIRRKW